MRFAPHLMRHRDVDAIGRWAAHTRQRETVQVIQSSSKTLVMLINDILDLSKMESGSLELESIVFSLEECIERALDLIAAKAQEKSLRLAYQYPRDVPRRIIGDEMRFSQVFT